MKYLLFEHAGSGNHGCEAIVRSTIDMLGDNDYYLETLSSKDDIHYGVDKIANLIDSSNIAVKSLSIRGLCYRLCGKFNKSLDFDDRERLYRHKNILIKDVIALSIGGDNYCYGGIIGSMRDKLKAFRIMNIPSVLWGCSINKEHLDTRTIEDLKQYKLITVRESLTKEVLESIDIKDNVISCSDPAFTLKKQETHWHDELFIDNNAVGINVSDFMEYYNAYPDATYRNFLTLIKYLVDKTNYNIVLIPHVRQEGNDDVVPINKLAKEINSSRVYVLDEDYNCTQLKDVISKCRMFIGCRTHSTIAAYSTCVPTLVVGYSIKAKGICKDIFGNYDDLLVDVREFKSDDDLLNKYLVFSKKENELRDHLAKIMPEYINRAYNAVEALKRLEKEYEKK